MNREDIIRMAREAGFEVLLPSEEVFGRGGVYTGSDDEISKYLEHFAALVIANHPPQSFMTWQEGYEAGKQTKRKPLTENEIKHLWYEACQTNLELTSQLIVHLARNIEAAHGIKGEA